MQHSLEFLARGGEMASLTRDYDWNSSPLGPAEDWPETLKTTLRLVLTSHHPMFIWWGPDLIQFYNDAYRQTMGAERHPSALGQPGHECWGEIWDIIGPQINSIMAGGEATWHVEQLVPTTRHGKKENIWWTYGYSPIADSSGVQGVLVICNDVTEEHKSKIELHRLNEELLVQINNCQRLEADQAFQLQLLDSLSEINEPSEIASVVFEMLGRQLGLARISFSNIDDPNDGNFVVEYSWNLPGINSLQGLRGSIADYSPAILNDLRQGKVMCITDTRSDERTIDGAYGSLESLAVLGVPIRRNGLLVACLSTHRTVLGDWSQNEINLFKEVAERIFSTIERRKIEAFRAASREKLYERQKEESQRLSALFQQAPSFMAVLRGPDHVYEMVNTSILQLLGQRDYVGFSVRQAVPELEGQGYIELLDNVYKTGEPFLGYGMPVKVFKTKYSAPEDRFVNFILQPIFEFDGSISGIFVEGNDVTEQYLIDLELKRVNEQLAEKIHDLELADKRKNEFLAMLAHELRNPLSPISAASEMLRLGQLDPQGVQRTSEIISRQIKHMTGLIDDLMDVSRVTRGLVALEKTKLNLQHMLLEAVEQLRPLVEHRHHQLAIEISTDTIFVNGDKKRLIQAVANLLNNAAKYTPDGGNIQLALKVNNNRVGIIVKDDGIGMDAVTARDAFQLFTQAERSADRTQGGLGIGLALVKSLVELHDGEVEGRSEGLGKGSEFSIWLPILHESDSRVDFKSSTTSSSSKSLRIMIVDDNVDAAHMLAMYLEAMGHSLAFTHTATEALTLSLQQPFDVFLLDIGLPEIDGYDLARMLRSQAVTANAGLVAITGYGQDSDRAKAKEAGFDHHLLKPVDIPLLLGLLDKM
ncbi:MAG: ATP-binding protein [Cellvibrio sp.]|uniref:ATP-binding protein n=1 Tax=Cellvibrio sp. TaxID=1965322 RepID=UPI0031A96F54